MHNPFTSYWLSGTWDDHASYSLGGEDWAMPVGTPLPAPASGTIENLANNGTGGHTVTLQFDNPVLVDGVWVHSLQMMHLSRFVEVGWYAEGAVIGYSGNTGLSTGPHVHVHALNYAWSSVHGHRVQFTRLVSVATAGSKNDQAIIQQAQDKGDNDMAVLVYYTKDDKRDGPPALYALAGEGQGEAAFLIVADQLVANALAANTRSQRAIYLTKASFDSWQDKFRAPVPVKMVA